MIAIGFSILAMIAARSPISLRASSMSSGRWTNDRATQSAPRSRPNSRSRRSFAVSGDSGMIAPGMLTPLRSESLPPTFTRVTAWRSSQRSTSRRSLPSSSRSCRPGAMTAKISGCGRHTRRVVPGAGSRSRRNAAPALSSTGPCANVPMRSFGPCRSISTPIGRPAFSSTARIACIRLRWSAGVPWLKLRRNTSTPAWKRALIAAGVELAGPSVATILALR